MYGPTSEQVRVLLRWLKEGPPGAIPIEQDGQSPGALVAVTWEDAGDRRLLEQLANWHPPFVNSSASVRRWLCEEVLPAADRLLFWIRDEQGEMVGHIGLIVFPDGARTAHLIDVFPANHSTHRSPIRESLARWTHETFGVSITAETARPAA